MQAIETQTLWQLSATIISDTAEKNLKYMQNSLEIIWWQKEC